MGDYICKYGLYHDKKVVDGNQSSNNGWIYTAYAQALGLPITQKYKYVNLKQDCISSFEPFKINRLPNMDQPPMSRDEIIGITSLLIYPLGYLVENNYYWYGEKPKYSLWVQLKYFFKIRNEHRNYLWKNNIEQCYQLSFTLSIHDKYYFNKFNGIKTSFAQWAMFNIYAFTTIIKKSNTTGKVSAKNVLWLQLRDLKSKFWIKYIDRQANFLIYFGKQHPFNKEV